MAHDAPGFMVAERHLRDKADATIRSVLRVTLRGDAFAPPLSPERFDLVHMRYVMTTIGRHRDLVDAALRLLRPGGYLAIQEGDASGLACYPPHPAWDRLKTVLLAGFQRAGGDCFAGRQIYRLLVEAGLEGVAFRPCQAGARSSDPLVDYLPATVLSTKPLILRHGLASEAELDALIVECRRHLAEPTTIQTSVIVIQAWGRKPSSAARRRASARGLPPIQ